MFGQFDESLRVDESSVDLSKIIGGPVLKDHENRTDSVIGTVTDAWIEGPNVVGTFRFHETPTADDYFARVQRGELRSTSVGYDAKYVESNSLEEGVPHYEARNWTPLELSIVALPADAGSMIRSQEIEQVLNESEVELDAIRSQQSIITEVPQVDEAEKKRLELEQARKEAAQAEKTRHQEIRKAVREAKLDEKLAEDYIERGTSVDEARTNIALFAKYAKEQESTNIESNLRVEVGTQNQESRRQALEESLLHRADARNFKLTEGAKEFYGKSMLRAVEAIVPRYKMESDVAYAKRAMASSDLPLALANVAEKGLQKQYELQPRTFSSWTRSDSLNNYKEYSQVKTGDRASLLERPENADAEESSFGEKNEVAQLKDYARIVSFSSQMLVNDDMGVISRLANSGGISVARLENRLAYSALTTNKTMKDGVALYHATHGNLGTAGAISETTIAEAYKLMRKQASTDGLDKLNLAPAMFICGPDQEVAARKFFASIIPNQTSNVNVFQGSMNIVVDAEITGNQYYLVANPSLIDTVVCYRLAGQEQPKIESRVKFENSSLQLKIDHAFAAAPMDWRGIVKNAGQ